MFLDLVLALASLFFSADAADRATVAELEPVYRVAVATPADPNGFEAAERLFTRRFEAKANALELRALASDAVKRFKAYVPKADAEDPFCQFHITFLLRAYRTLLEPLNDALKAGKRDAFVSALNDFQAAFDALPPPNSMMTLLVQNAWLQSLVQMRGNLSAFPETTGETLENILRALPSDEVLNQRSETAVAGEYSCFFLLLLDDFERNLPRKSRLLYSRIATQALYLRYMEASLHAMAFPIATRPEVDELYPPKHAFQYNFAGRAFLSALEPAVSNAGDTLRDTINLCRLGLAGQIFYRRHGRPPASFDELVADGLLRALPVHYSKGQPFTLIDYKGEPRITADIRRDRAFFRIVSPDRKSVFIEYEEEEEDAP